MLKKLLLFWRSTSLFNWHIRRILSLEKDRLGLMELLANRQQQIEDLKRDACYARVQALLQELEYIKYEHEQVVKVLDFVDKYSMHKHPNLIKTCRRFMKDPSWELHFKQQEKVKNG